jgi:hypothetical protein
MMPDRKINLLSVQKYQRQLWMWQSFCLANFTANVDDLVLYQPSSLMF